VWLGVTRNHTTANLPQRLFFVATLRIKFGRRVRALRRDLQLTQEQLAEQAAVSVDFLSLVERGVNAPSFETLERVARALHVPVQELFVFTKSGQRLKGV